MLSFFFFGNSWTIVNVVFLLLGSKYSIFTSPKLARPYIKLIFVAPSDSACFLGKSWTIVSVVFLLFYIVLNLDSFSYSSAFSWAYPLTVFSKCADSSTMLSTRIRSFCDSWSLSDFICSRVWGAGIAASRRTRLDCSRSMG